MNKTNHKTTIEVSAGIRLAAALATSATWAAADTAVGWREAAATNVAADAIAALDGRLTVGDGGSFVKIGAGTLSLPQSQIDRNAPYTVQSLEGTLSIEVGAASANAAVPAFVAAEAAFWVDATPDSGLQTSDDNGTTRVMRWCDVREANPFARAYPSALPAHVATGRLIENTANPAVTTFDTRAAVYFGGIGSGQYMAFKDASDADLSINKVFHFFLVHGIDSTWGPALGCTVNENNNGFRVNTWANGKFTGFDSLPGGHFLSAAEYNGALQTARFSLDGTVIDAFATSPRKGVQLLAGTVTDGFQKYNNFFRQRANGNAIGGDFLCEAVLFTNKLSEAKIAQIERYLLAKWNIPGGDSLAHLDADVGRVGVATRAVVEVAPADGEATGPLAFSGEGTVVKTDAGDLVIGPSGSVPPFAGDFKLAGGRILVRGGMVPALTVAAGQTLDASFNTPTNVTSPGIDVQIDDGTVVTLSRGGGSDFVKTGEAEARVKSVDKGVSAIRVEEGELVFSAPSAIPLWPAGTWAAGEGLDIQIANAGFEDYFTAHPAEYSFQSTSVGTEYNGWYMSPYNGYFKRANANWSTTCKADIPPAEGESVLYLKTVNAEAYTTVSLPGDGIYELSCVSSANKSTGTTMGVWLGTDWTSAERIGSLPDGQMPWPRTYCRFAASAGTYALGFKTGAGDSTEYGWTIDDLKLRRVTEAGSPASEELVENGGFERAGGYSASSSSSGRVAYNNSNAAVSGYNAYEGGYCFQLTKNGWVSWNVAFPEAGLYRLRFAAHSRTRDRTSNGMNPIQATLEDGVGHTTAILTVNPFGCNFYEYSALFFVAEAGTCTLKLRGSSESDRRSYIDGVSVRRASAMSAPAVAGRPKLFVGEGAALRLDYPGKITVSSLRLGGVRHVGTVTAETAPDFIKGIGSIEVKPNGSVFIVR